MDDKLGHEGSIDDRMYRNRDSLSLPIHLRALGKSFCIVANLGWILSWMDCFFAPLS